jgi:1-aminocyclopropane-1-carboxylate deaminase
VSLADFPRYSLTFGPSPIHPVKRLSAHLGGAQIWMKREDVSSGLAYGGNKVRKLEYIVPDALASGADTLVSIGGVQSNHTRQVAAVAAHLGMKAVLVQEAWVDWPDSVNDRVGNIMLSRIMGAEVRLDPSGFDIGIRDSWQQALADVEARGGKPYGIPAGASEHRLGGLGLRGGAAGAGAGCLLRHDHRLHRHGQHACGNDRRLRRSGSPPAGDRHRCLGDAGEDS